MGADPQDAQAFRFMYMSFLAFVTFVLNTRKLRDQETRC